MNNKTILSTCKYESTLETILNNELWIKFKYVIEDEKENRYS